MPADGHHPTRARFSNKSPLQMAKDTARDCEAACSKLAVPKRPPMIADMTPAKIEALRGNAVYTDLKVAWNGWQCDYSAAISINRSRLRGALWAYRELAKAKDDESAQLFREKLGAFLGKEWGAHAVPDDARECDQLADMTAGTIAKARRLTWEDFNRMAQQ